MYDEDMEDERWDRDPEFNPFYRRFAGPDTALWAEDERNPRNLPCPTCRQPNRLTPRDKASGYQCDRCADIAEMGGDW